jgi:protease-4
MRRTWAATLVALCCVVFLNSLFAQDQAPPTVGQPPVAAAPPAATPPAAAPAPAAEAPKQEPPKAAPATPGVVAVFDMSKGAIEYSAGGGLLSGSVGGPSLRELVSRMKKARDDANVKAIVLLGSGGGFGNAQIEELRQVIDSLRKAGKPVFAFADSLSTGDYVLLSGASKLTITPTGEVFLVGFRGEAMFFRGLFDMFGVQPDFLTCGEYKSAAEQYMRTSPSPQAAEMQNWLLDGIYAASVRQIAAGRGVDEAKVRGWIDGGPYTAEAAVKAGIIDAVQPLQDFTTELRRLFGEKVVFERRYGLPKPKEIDFSSPFALLELFGEAMKGPKTSRSKKPAVAIIYVDGAIAMEGGGLSLSGEATATAGTIRRALDMAAADDSIKAVVLRVNSPGGSPLASEIILDATRRVKAKKPFVVSMGDVAGSGGYYVACASDLIYADETTITGSIGVVGGKLATRGVFNRFGITFHAFQRGANAGFLNTTHPFTDLERERMQNYMNETYAVFKGHVIASRGPRLKKPIDELAGGRVYTGRQALDLGLVDRIGTLDDALTYVAGEAKVTEYETRVMPEPRSFFEELIGGEGKDPTDPLTVRTGRGEPAGLSFDALRTAAVPFLSDLDPRTVQRVLRALRQAEIIQRERVSLAMPEYEFRDR